MSRCLFLFLFACTLGQMGQAHAKDRSHWVLKDYWENTKINFDKTLKLYLVKKIVKVPFALLWVASML